MKQGLIVIGAIAVIALAIWYEVAMWQECRRDHPLLFCMRILSQ